MNMNSVYKFGVSTTWFNLSFDLHMRSALFLSRIATIYLIKKSQHLILSSSKELDTLLALTTKNLRPASLNQDIQRAQHDISIHAMELCRCESAQPVETITNNQRDNLTLRHSPLPMDQLIDRQNRSPLPSALNPLN